MRNRLILSAGAIALVASSCAQPEPQILSEAQRSASATELTSSSETPEREPQEGRFIARCATEADGGTPGMTFFTDGTQNVTDHCLSRYYIGVQPAPGALYVADEDAGTYAPARETATATQTPSSQWTPAQPRTDAGPEDSLTEETDGSDPDDAEDDRDGTTGETTPDTTVTPTEGTPTTAPPVTSPGGTVPTTPGQTDPGTPGDSDPSATGSTVTSPTTVPTVTEVPGTRQVPPAPTQASLASADPMGSAGSQAPVRPRWLPPLPWFPGPTG